MNLTSIFSKKLTSESFFNLLFWGLWSNVLFECVRGGIKRLPFIGELRDEFLLIGFVFLIFASIPFMVKKIDAMHIFVYVCIVVLYQACYCFFPENAVYLKKEEFRFLYQVLPYFFVGYCYVNDEKKMHILNIIAIASVFVYFFYYVVFHQASSITSGGDEMVSSYNLIPNILVLASCMVIFKRSIISVIALFLGLFLIISFGTRGPIVVCVIFGSIWILYFLLKGHFKIAIATTSLLVASYGFLLFFAEQLINLIEKFNMSSRIFKKLLLADEIESGREFLYTKVVSNIDILNVHGFAGDRYILSGAYTHNFFYEMWYSFGFLGGSFLILIFFAIIIAAFTSAKKSDMYLLVILVSSAFGMLMFTGSFMHQGKLFFLIGYSINIINKRCYGIYTNIKRRELNFNENCSYSAKCPL